MRRWPILSGCTLVLLTALAVVGFPNSGHAAAGDPLLDYGTDLVSDYVSRGVDLFVSKYGKDQKEHGVFNSAPAVQPYLTLHGPAGLGFGLWGSFALVDREEDAAHKADPSTGFAGLKTLDEIDYTLSWDWKNKLGGFSAGLVAYQNPNPSGQTAYDEMYVRWATPFLAAVSPTITHYVVVAAPNPTLPGTSYTSLAFSGGEAINWKLSLGESSHLQDITAAIGKGFGSFSATFNVSYRPTPQIVGPYDTDGHYLLNGVQKNYPKAIAWLTLSYTGSVTE